jgi:hypothetical protein
VRLGVLPDQIDAPADHGLGGVEVGLVPAGDADVSERLDDEAPFSALLRRGQSSLG